MSNVLNGKVPDTGLLKGSVGALLARDGYSAYEIAVKNGFEGSEEEWLESLRGERGIQGIRGEKGDPFVYEDFTPEQLAALRGEKGADGTMTFEDLTEEQKESLRGDKGAKGDPFVYEDFTEEQLAALKGEQGDPFTYEDFTEEQLDALKGEQGKSGVYIGSGEIPEGYSVQIDPNGEAAEGILTRTDTTLSESGVAADAKTTGEKIREVSEAIGDKVSQKSQYFLMQSPNGTIYKIAITDSGVLQVVGESDEVLDGLLKGRLLLWNDEFDTLDTELWDYETGYIRNGEPQYYTSDVKNVYVKDSILHIVALKDNPADGYEWSSGSIFSDGLKKGFCFNEGLVEAKVKIPKIGTGIWPAFWHKGAINGGEDGNGLGWAYCGEIDTFDLIGSSYQPGGFYQEINKTRQHYSSGNAITPPEDEWIIFGVEKTATTLTMYYNREQVGTWDITEFYGYPGCAFNLKFNLAMGSTSGDIPEDLESAEFLVDWVRYYAPADIETSEDISTSNTVISIGDTYAMNKDRQMPIYPIFTGQLDNYFLAWESSDESVATVSGGYVKALANGTTTITANDSSGNQVVAIEIDVDDANTVLVEDFDIYTIIEGLPSGSSITLQAYYTPTWATDMSIVCTSDSPYIDCDGATITNNSTSAKDVDITVTVKSADGNVTKTVVIPILASKSYNVTNTTNLLHEYNMTSLALDEGEKESDKGTLTWSDTIGTTDFIIKGGKPGDAYQEYTTSGLKSNSNNLRTGYSVNIADTEMTGQYTIVGFVTDMTTNNSLTLNNLTFEGIAPLKLRMWSNEFGDSVGHQYKNIGTITLSDTPVMMFISIDTDAQTCRWGAMLADGTYYSSVGSLPEEYATNTTYWRTGIASPLPTQKFIIGTYKHVLFYDAIKSDDELQAIGEELIGMYL